MAISPYWILITAFIPGITIGYFLSIKLRIEKTWFLFLVSTLLGWVITFFLIGLIMVIFDLNVTLERLLNAAIVDPLGFFALTFETGIEFSFGAILTLPFGVFLGWRRKKKLKFT